LSDAAVHLDRGDERLRTSTDGDGRFRFEGLPPGTVSLFANAYDAVPVFLRRDATVSEASWTDVSIDLTREIRGTVVARALDGTPVAAEASVEASDTDRPDAWITETNASPGDGTCSLLVPGPGRYPLALGGHDHLLPDGPVPVDLTREETVEGVRLSATADPADGEIAIEVTDAETGEPVVEGDFQYEGSGVTGSGSLQPDGVSLAEHRLGAYRFVVSSAVRVPVRVDVAITLTDRRPKASIVLPRSDAVRIVDLARVSPAGEEGLRPGDVVVRYGETPVPTVAALHAATGATSSDDRARLLVVRDGADRTLDVRGGRLGVTVQNARRAEAGR
jgi:hypothetical protein